jgi:general secretion pathway protein A
MYLGFYGLKEKPFNATPDPRFLYLAPGHREALSQLLYGVRENKGFIVLTGDIGTGKTTLLHTLRQRLGESAAISYVFNSTLPFDEILEYVIEDFGITKAGTSRSQRLTALYNFLIERRRVGQTTVLILDEAQNLEPATLEQVRLLSNFETPTEKLLQIVLAGQPELRTKLQLPELRQLKQRVGLAYTIPLLTPAETRDYIRARLSIAGARDLGLFTERAVTRIAEYAGGVPRLMNILSDHCLLFGYADRMRRVDRDTVEQAIVYMEDGLRRPAVKRGAKGWPGMAWMRRAVGVLVTAVLSGGAVFALRGHFASLIDAARSVGRGFFTK